MGKRADRKQRTTRRRRKGSRARIACGVALLAVMMAGAGAAVAHYRDTGVRERPVADAEPVILETPATHTPARSPSPSPSPSASKKPEPSASSSPSPSPSSTRIDVPAVGPGTFRTAQADSSVVGEGARVRRYKVVVEDGIAIDPGAAADEVAAILGDERGWTEDGVNSFRLVGSGSYDFVVKIATPGTVDRICGAAGLLTRGEVNCSVGTDVVVNLKRWVLGSPEFAGPIGEYRALIVNHEVGHRIGHGHETCPGPGRPAPAMMQQIKGLQGCVANAWPYDGSGKYLGGPSVP
ncbi:DUF3152 domain-containing protein [Streptomyces sp. TRM66268-LWL]|uniref:DUF3152 domain-containing protein n=1 Tax=Streptomyces polyasparticus TaxID=2767826 RepID=A0ABR7SF33_9ACTN|nr:DUF3152 domain-containing protein [Streptomyces polyasparticus]MBC9713066.1 DUF3152 domain-containing protein [Streptomyces polyasparticus]